jgi:hypothetical protein
MSNRSKGSSSFIYIIAVMGALMIMNYTVKKVRQFTEPAPLGADRAAERAAAMSELNAANQSSLTTYAWQNKPNEIVRLPIDRAMELTIQEWENPDEARAKLISLSEKAAYQPPPEPEAPSEFE